MHESPPLRYLIPYRIVGMRIPAQWRRWLEADVDSPGFAMREVAKRQLLMAPFLILMSVQAGSSFGFIYWVTLLLGMMGGQVLVRSSARVREGLRGQVLRSHERKWRRSDHLGEWHGAIPEQD